MSVACKLLRGCKKASCGFGVFNSAKRVLSMTSSSRSSGIDLDNLSRRSKADPRSLSEEEWRAILKPQVFHVAREHGTERAFTSPLYDNHEPGSYLCACCKVGLFNSTEKFDSGSGWPSFYDVAKKGIVVEKVDKSHGMYRTEVLCSKCDAHLGHVFNDGPPPTGLRYCINGITLDFSPK